MGAAEKPNLLEAVSVAVDRAMGEGYSPETVSRAINDVLRALMESRVHGELTLEELCRRCDLLEARFEGSRGYLRENLEDPRLYVGETEMVEAIHEILGKGVSIPKKTIVEKRDEFLGALLPYLRLTNRWSVRSALDGLNLCEAENNSLRRNLIWVASQPEVSLETRRELSRRIRAWGGDTSIGPDSAEDEAQEINHYRRIAERVCDLAQEAVDAGIPEAPSLDDPQAIPASYSDTYLRGRVSYNWTQRMDALLVQLRGFTPSEAPPSGTLAEIRALTESEKPRGT